MPRLRVKATWDGQSWKVNLPEYSMIPGSWQPVTPTLIDANGPLYNSDPTMVAGLNPTCEVDVPDRICDPDTDELSKDRIRELYKGNELWDNETVTDDL